MRRCIDSVVNSAEPDAPAIFGNVDRHLWSSVRVALETELFCADHQRRRGRIE